MAETEHVEIEPLEMQTRLQHSDRRGGYGTVGQWHTAPQKLMERVKYEWEHFEVRGMILGSSYPGNYIDLSFVIFNLTSAIIPAI